MNYISITTEITEIGHLQKIFLSNPISENKFDFLITEGANTAILGAECDNTYTINFAIQTIFFRMNNKFHTAGNVLM